jgi:hypothetical protein
MITRTVRWPYSTSLSSLEPLNSLSQLTDIHSLRWVNAVSTFSSIGFAATTIGVKLYNGIPFDKSASLSFVPEPS